MCRHMLAREVKDRKEFGVGFRDRTATRRVAPTSIQSKFPAEEFRPLTDVSSMSAKKRTRKATHSHICPSGKDR